MLRHIWFGTSQLDEIETADVNRYTSVNGRHGIYLTSSGMQLFHATVLVLHSWIDSVWIQLYAAGAGSRTG